MNQFIWIELLQTNNRLDRFIQLCMIQASRNLEKPEKDEFKKLYLLLKDAI